MSPYLYIRLIKKDRRPLKEIFDEEAEANKGRNILVKTEIVWQTGPRRKKFWPRVLAGHLLAGEGGGYLGALSAHGQLRGNTRFRLYYADGHTKEQTVMDGGTDWKRYMELLDKNDANTN